MTRRATRRVTRLPPERLDSLYTADGFGGETTVRAKVIRELIDEIRALRAELAAAVERDRGPAAHDAPNYWLSTVTPDGRPA